MRLSLVIQLLIFSTLVIITNGCSEEPSSHTKDYTLDASLLPEYEAHLDHLGFLENWSNEFYHAGKLVYRDHCFDCHGNPEFPGSLPNARHFWEQPFKNGNDPHSIYKTVTLGHGLMPPMSNLSPKEKYQVIHFIREEFIAEHNPDQYFEITPEYLSSLPEGDTLGPEPNRAEPWKAMNYGNFFMHTYELANSDDPPREISRGPSPLANEDYKDLNFAYKGIAIRLDDGPGGVAAGNTFVLFDHDLMRMTGIWTGEGFIDYQDILLNDRHNIYPRTVGKIEIENPIRPGWANPANESFDDPRFVAVDGRPFGPLPKDWAHYKGLYYHEGKVIIKYTIGEAEILESYELEKNNPTPVISRTINVNKNSQALTLSLAPVEAKIKIIGITQTPFQQDGLFHLSIPAGTPTKFQVFISPDQDQSLDDITQASNTALDLEPFSKGGKPHYPKTYQAPIIKGNDKDAYASDVFSFPEITDSSQWVRMRPTGIDFLPSGDEALICTIDGDVWHLKGILKLEGNVEWRRIASGLFQPLGIKYHNEEIFVSCRNQIVKLVDLNGDGETDFYESFNSDHQVTEHFHEFAMGLQVDEAGNFYYAKSGRHARRSLVPQHGTLIQVSPDGKTSKILANGFRAANGVCLNPDGTFFVTDQEGYWNPMNRINRVQKGGFYGNMYGYGAPKDSSDEAMIHPMAWIDMRYDRSPAELVWATSNQWGPLNGKLLSLSYGYGKVFAVLTQEVNQTMQGGIFELPIAQFPTGIMRARFNPVDGQFYGCGMSAWATNQMIQAGGLYRIRYTGKSIAIPIKLSAFEGQLALTFSEMLNPTAVQNPENFEINAWDLKRSRRYGSDRYNERSLDIASAQLATDQKTILLDIPDLAPTWCMEIIFSLKNKEGAEVSGAIHNTIHQLAKKELNL